MISRSLLCTLLCVSLCNSTLAATVQLPELGDSASSYVSLPQEHDLGRLWLRQLRAQANVIDDPLAVQFLEHIIYRLVPHSEVKISEFEFVIIDQRELNAFAVPGGIIGINLGLFLHTRDEDELSGVLAHELAHLSQRHFARQLEQADKQAPIAIATLLASILLIATNNPDIGFAGLVGSQAASIQQQLAYSREWEREADRVGIQTLANSGLDPSAMPSMFQQMLKSSRYQQRPPEFLLTHPVTEARIADAADRAERFPKQARTSSFEFYLLQHLALLKYQLQGEQKETYFQHLLEQESNTSTTQRAAALYSLASLSLEQRQPKQALTYWQRLPTEFRSHTAAVSLQATILNTLGETTQALHVISAALPFAPQDYLLLSTQATLLEQQNPTEATKVWRQLSDLRPTNPTIWRQLALSANKANQEITAYRAQAEFRFYTGQQPQAVRQMDTAIKLAKKVGDFKQELALKQRQHSMASAPSKF